MVIIDNFDINLSFQLHICNPLFENALLLTSFFKLADLAQSTISFLSSPNNNIIGFDPSIFLK